MRVVSGAVCAGWAQPRELPARRSGEFAGPQMHMSFCSPECCSDRFVATVLYLEMPFS